MSTRSGNTEEIRRRRRLLTPRLVSTLMVLFVFAGVVGIRHLGGLQFLELQAYDFLIRHQKPAASSEPIVLIEMTESDIHNASIDYPIPDDRLAELLVTLEAAEPTAIGLDIWRDLPVPRSGIHLEKFNQVLTEHANIVPIFTQDGISAPAIFKTNFDRIAYNDNFVADYRVSATIPKVRRSTLSVDSAGDEVWQALPFRLATFYLEQRGITPSLDTNDPTIIHLGKASLRPFHRNDGAYVGEDDRGWQLLLDFKCPTNFTRFTFTQVLTGQVPAEKLKDRILIIGMNTPSVSDERVTPMQRNHRGPELQAGATHQLLRHALDGEPQMRFWNDLVEDAWILLWCILAGTLGYTVRSPWLSAPISVLAVSGLTFIAWGAFQIGWWIPLIAPAAAFIPAGTLVTSYVSFQEKRSREQLMQLFSRQVSPDIAQALWEQRDQFLAGKRPKSQKLTATVVFTDLEGFTATSEKLDPAVLMDWLNEYMEAMATAIMAHHGVIEKYIGDAIMAVFGVPLPRTKPEEISEDARNAVRCTLAMEVQMKELNARWRERGLPECAMRIGVHTGPLVAGSLGSSERQEYTVIGDTVNTASRLESYDKEWVDPSMPDCVCRVLISEATLRHLNSEFHTTRVGTMPLKNKSEPVTIYSVIARRAEKPVKP